MQTAFVIEHQITNLRKLGPKLFTQIHFYVLFTELTREQMILLALLVGSDYTIGISGIGPVTALEILAAFPPAKNKQQTYLSQSELLSGLNEFKHWLSGGGKLGLGRTTLRSKLQNIHISESFPSLQVVEAYLQPEVETSDDKFTWGKPDIESLIYYAREKFGWTKMKTEDILNPVMKKLEDACKQKTIRDFFATKHKIEIDLTEGKVSKRVKMAIERMGKSKEELSKEEQKSKKKKTDKEKSGNSRKRAIKKDSATQKETKQKSDTQGNRKQKEKSKSRKGKNIDDKLELQEEVEKQKEISESLEDEKQKEKSNLEKDNDQSKKSELQEENQKEKSKLQEDKNQNLPTRTISLTPSEEKLLSSARVGRCRRTNIEFIMKEKADTKPKVQRKRKKEILTKEVIPQKERDKVDILKSKLKAIEIYRKSKIEGKQGKRIKKVRQPKEDAELSENSDSS